MEYRLTTEGAVSSRAEPQKGGSRRWGQGVELESSIAVILYKVQLCPPSLPPPSLMLIPPRWLTSSAAEAPVSGPQAPRRVRGQRK